MISDTKVMLKIPKVHKVHTGIENFSYIAPKHEPEDLKKSNAPESFKAKLKELANTDHLLKE